MRYVRTSRHRCIHFGRVCSIIVGPDPEWRRGWSVRFVWFRKAAK